MLNSGTCKKVVLRLYFFPPQRVASRRQSGFEHRATVKGKGSIPLPSAILRLVAQSGERRTVTAKVARSKLVKSAKFCAYRIMDNTTEF